MKQTHSPFVPSLQSSIFSNPVTINTTSPIQSFPTSSHNPNGNVQKEERENKKATINSHASTS